MITSMRRAATLVKLHEYIRSLPRRPGEPPLDHPIIKVGDNGPLDNTPVYDVPPGHYFGMGDNRDNSQDSRVLSAVGYIPAENLVGKAQFLFFSIDGSARWCNLEMAVRDPLSPAVPWHRLSAATRPRVA